MRGGEGERGGARGGEGGSEKGSRGVVVWGRERWMWTVGVGAAAGVDSTLPRTRHVSVEESEGETRRESGRESRECGHSIASLWGWPGTSAQERGRRTGIGPGWIRVTVGRRRRPQTDELATCQ